MPRQARTDRILAEKEEKLKVDVDVAAAMVERLSSELRLVRELRKQLAAPPRSRAKPRAVTPTVTAA